MARVTIELMTAAGRAVTAATLQMPSSKPIAIAEVQSTASAQTVESGGDPVTAPTAATAIWAVAAEGGDVLVKFGIDQGLAAAAGDGWRVRDGERRTWHASAAGEMCSVIDAV